VEKERFALLVKNYTCLTPEETSELIGLQDLFPYSQAIHNLGSRGARDNSMGIQNTLLSLSAIYSTDRAVLKSIMTAPRTEIATGKPAEEAKSKISESSDTNISDSGDILRKDLSIDLKKLEDAIKKYESSLVHLEKNQPKESGTENGKKPKKAEVNPGKAMDILEEIKTTKKKIKPEGEKQKEQIEIIDNFIKTQPVIARGKAATPPSDQTDLAEKSLVYGDNIVSETLVEILLKQGKKDKAIDVLRKLIWKFPQKKAYFAAQIENLKK
jgi:hypothetical protein